jgi:outer membrane cobalamin receptor
VATRFRVLGLGLVQSIWGTEAIGDVIDVMSRRTDGSNLVRSHKYSCLLTEPQGKC